MASLKYVIKYVSDMDRAVEFYRDRIGLSPRFSSSHWTEFDTGETTLALHLAGDEHPAGSSQLGFGVEDIGRFHSELSAAGVEFTSPPTEQFGSRIAKFIDVDGAECSVSGK